MKKKFKIFIVVLFLIMSFNCLCLNGLVLHADISAILTADSFADINLYNHLLRLSGESYLTVDAFKNTTTLNLSFSAISNSNQQISLTSIKGLEQLDLSKLTYLDISGHSIQDFSKYLNNLSSLETLNISNNNATFINISNLNKLKTIYLQNNNFCEFNNILLSSINPTEKIETGENSFEIKNITRKVYLSHNYLNIENLPENQLVNEYKIGLQGFHTSEEKYGKQIISFLPYDNTTSIDIIKTTDTTEAYSLPLKEGEIVYNKLELSYGEYKIRFNSTDGDDNKFIFENNIKIKVKKPTLSLFQNNTPIDLTAKIFNSTTAKIEGEGEIFLIVNNKRIEENTFTINQDGIYNLKYYQIIDGNTSEETNFTIYSYQASYFQFVYIIFAITAFIIIMTLILHFLNKTKNSNLKSREKF